MARHSSPEDEQPASAPIGEIPEYEFVNYASSTKQICAGAQRIDNETTYRRDDPQPASVGNLRSSVALGDGQRYRCS